MWFISDSGYGKFGGILMTKNKQKLLTEEMIPTAPLNEDVFDTLNINIDGYNAQCFIAERFGSNKIVILFEKEHPEYGDSFTTKHFQFKEPGKMNWGHEGKFMHITIA